MDIFSITSWRRIGKKSQQRCSKSIWASPINSLRLWNWACSPRPRTLFWTDLPWYRGVSRVFLEFLRSFYFYIFFYFFIIFFLNFQWLFWIFEGFFDFIFFHFSKLFFIFFKTIWPTSHHGHLFNNSRLLLQSKWCSPHLNSQTEKSKLQRSKNTIWK